MFIVMCIGCLECCVPSELVGFFATEAEADRVANKLSMATSRLDVDYQVFKLGSLGELAESYKELLFDKTNP